MRQRDLAGLHDACLERLQSEALRLRHAGASALKVGDEMRALACYAKAEATCEASQLLARSMALWGQPRRTTGCRQLGR